MKDMKKRIIALVLVVVMSLLSLVGCAAGYDFIEDDLNKYVDFDYAAFKAALQKIEIEDGDFTTNGATREKKVAEAMYKKLADAIIAAASDDDKLKEGELSDRDVLYFVYYAKNEKTNDVYFFSDMADSALTGTNKTNHVINLGGIDVEDEDADEFMKLVKKNLAKGDVKSHLYNALTKEEITEIATEAYKEANKTVNNDALKKAIADALKVKDGDKLVISYTVSYNEKTSEGQEVVKKQTTAYETVTINANDPFLSKFIEKDSVAEIGGQLEVYDSVDEESGDVKTTKTVKVKVENEDGSFTNYTYTDVKILWKVEGDAEPIATFKYTPYKSDKKVTADQLGGAQNNLKDVELTYYVYPSYYLSVPSAEEFKDGKAILTYILGSGITEESLDVFGEDYKNGDKTVKALVEEIVKIYDAPELDSNGKPTSENDYYGDDDTLRKLLVDIHNAEVAGGSKPTDEQKAAIADAEAALAKEQRKVASEFVDKIIAAKNGNDLAGAAIYEEYYDDTYHTLEDAYKTDIEQKVHKEIWKLIDEMVVFKNPKAPEYPEELLDEYWHLIYENYEYLYYNGSDETTKKAYFDTYDTFEAYLIKTLKVKTADDAVKALKGYIESDIKAGAYDIDEHAYEETYGDAAAEKIEQAKKDAAEAIEEARADADKFLIDDAYMKAYKKEIGNAAYNSYVDEYGEHNLRASFQFNRLFYYLASTNLEKVKDGEHTHTSAAYVEKDGVRYIDFRTLSYKTK